MFQKLIMVASQERGLRNLKVCGRQELLVAGRLGRGEAFAGRLQRVTDLSLRQEQPGECQTRVGLAIVSRHSHGEIREGGSACGSVHQRCDER